MNSNAAPLFRPHPGHCALGCKSSGREPVRTYSHGTFCPRHARMMAPRSSWLRLGIPFPDGQEPDPFPAAPVVTEPGQHLLGFSYRTETGGHRVYREVEPFRVIYAPCPEECGQATCVPDGDPAEPCLACQLKQHGIPSKPLAIPGGKVEHSR